MEGQEQSKGIKIPNIMEQANEACEAAKPSEELSYWSKRSCKNCYGRGIEGKITIPLPDNNKVTTDLMCSCAKRRYERWRKVWITNWLKDNANKEIKEINEKLDQLNMQTDDLI